MSPTTEKGRTRAARRYPSRDQKILILNYRQILGKSMAASYDMMDPFMEAAEMGQNMSSDDIEEQMVTIHWLTQSVLLVRNGFRNSDLEKHGLYGFSIPLRERKRKYRGLKKFVETSNLEESYMERLQGALKGVDLALNMLIPTMPGQKMDKLLESDKLDLLERNKLDDAVMLLITSYLSAIKLLKASWNQLFYVLQVTSIVRWDLSHEDSTTWHKYMNRWHEPPPFIVMEAEKLANDRNIVVHVYDSDNELVFEVIPAEYLASVPWAEWSATRQSQGKARFTWHYRKTPPANVSTFSRGLTPVERKRITEFLAHREQLDLPALPIEEIAALTGAGTVTRQQEPHEWQQNPSKSDEQVLSEYMLHRKIWTMDLDR